MSIVSPHTMPSLDNAIIIRTSDRSQFRNCRRRWNWSSHLGHNLEPIRSPSPLWYGTGIHFALEDYHGVGVYGSLIDAFNAFVIATYDSPNVELPVDWMTLYSLGKDILNYYVKYWEPAKGGLKTFYYDRDGKGLQPQVEANFISPLDFEVPKSWGLGLDQYLSDEDIAKYNNVVYSGTIDRVIIDEYNRLWVVDYKTAKNRKTGGFLNDSQIVSYCYFAQKMYPEYEVAGMIYWQFMKKEVKHPPVLASGHLSTNKKLNTSSMLYMESLIDHYGSVQNAPEAVKDTYLHLTDSENENRDTYIDRIYVHVNQTMLENEGKKILMELEDMLNPNLPLYPNPNYMCATLCPFYETCISVDDGSDWAHQLKISTRKRVRDDENWKNFLPSPSAHVHTQTRLDELSTLADFSFNLNTEF